MTDPAAVPPVLLSIPEACRVLNVGRSTLYELLARRHLEAVKVGSRRLVVAASITAYVEWLRAGAEFAASTR